MTPHGRDTSDLKVWYREDLLHLLRGLHVASGALDEPQRIGFDMAVEAIALAVGIDPEAIIHER